MINQDYGQTRPVDILKARILVFGMGFLGLVLTTNLVLSYLFTSATQAKYLYTDNMIKNYMLSKLDVPKGTDGVNDDGQIRLVGNSKHLQSIYKIEGTNFSIGSDLTDEARKKCTNIPEFEREHFTRNNTFIRASLDQLKIYSILIKVHKSSSLVVSQNIVPNVPSIGLVQAFEEHQLGKSTKLQ